MREDELPSPGLINGGSQLRRQMANAISYLEVNKRPDGTHPEAENLVAFLAAAKTEAEKYDEVTPVNTVAATVTGTAQVGQTLSVALGTWTGGGITYTYQWQKSGANIAGATSPTYVPVVGDIGAPIRVLVTGTNSVGNAVRTTAATANVIAA